MLKLSKTTMLTLVAATLGVSAPALAHDDDNYRRQDDRYGHDWNRDGRDDGRRAAIYQCSRAAQREASRYGRARVTEISDINWVRGGYEVRGRLVVEQPELAGREPAVVTPDPARQFPSPYSYGGGNPISATDPAAVHPATHRAVRVLTRIP